MDLLTEVIRLLITMIEDQRSRAVREEKPDYSALTEVEIRGDDGGNLDKLLAETPS